MLHDELSPTSYRRYLDLQRNIVTPTAALSAGKLVGDGLWGIAAILWLASVLSVATSFTATRAGTRFLQWRTSPREEEWVYVKAYGHCALFASLMFYETTSVAALICWFGAFAAVAAAANVHLRIIATKLGTSSRERWYAAKLGDSRVGTTIGATVAVVFAYLIGVRGGDRLIVRAGMVAVSALVSFALAQQIRIARGMRRFCEDQRSPERPHDPDSGARQPAVQRAA